MMPKEKKNSMEPETPEQQQRSKERMRAWRAAAFLALAAVVLIALIWGLFRARKVLFSENPHFKLKKMTLKGGTFWREKERSFARRSGIPDEANLFALDYRKLKSRMEAIPNIEKAEVERILPDRLNIRIWERIPRAMLYHPNSPWLVDEEGIVIPRRESAVTRNTVLPVILLERRLPKLKGGEKITALKPALDLVMMALRSFPDIEILTLKIRENDSIEFVMRYRSGRCYAVTLPVQNRGLGFMLSALQTAIINAHWKQIQVSRFNMMFDGRVILN